MIDTRSPDQRMADLRAKIATLKSAPVPPYGLVSEMVFDLLQMEEAGHLAECEECLRVTYGGRP